MNANDRGVPYHCTFDQVLKLLKSKQGFSHIENQNSQIYKLLFALQEEVEISSEQPHNYPIDPILEWHDPIFKKAGANDDINNDGDLSMVMDSENSDDQMKLLMTQNLISKARLAILFVCWNKFQSAKQKSELLFDFLKNY